MKIAIIGSGISGLAAAYYLHKDHDVHVYEADQRLGGHTATVDVFDEGKLLAVDTGFIVYNDWTYPEFIQLLKELGVATQATRMSFSVSDSASGLEYAGTNVNTLFAQRRNLVSPRYWRLLRDILRFNTQVETDLQQNPTLQRATLGTYLRDYHYSTEFHDLYLIPMGAAIWSSAHASMLAFPLVFFVRFFRNHGLLNLKHRPEWRVIKGGSREYLAPLTAGFTKHIHLNTPVQRIQRIAAAEAQPPVQVFTKHSCESFDHVILACHSDQALRLLADPSAAEHAILAAIPYHQNDVVLHTDQRLLPRSTRAWACWNVRIGGQTNKGAALTYNMNLLQNLQSRQTWCVTLNQTAAINPNLIKAQFSYAHPQFTLAGIAAQQRWAEINGVNNTWYCGAYWRNGFHEDGVWSAKRVATQLTQQIAATTHTRSAALAEAP